MKKEAHLDTFTIGFMCGVALIYDIVGIAFSWMGMGWIIMPVFYLHFWFWFHLHDIKFFTPKRGLGLGIGAVLEFITAGIAPAFFINVLTVALDYKAKETVAKMPGGGAAIKAAQKAL